MEVEELLARAWGAVQKAGIPEPLQEYAFKEALARLGGPTPAAGHRAVVDFDSSLENDADEGSPGESDVPVDLTAPFAKFARESGIAVEDLERVFYITDGTPHLNGPRTRFGKNAADQAKAVAVAITAAYNFVRDETPISDDVVKAETARLKIDIARNWARTMAGLTGASWIGATRQKQFKTTNSTRDALRKIVGGITGTPAE